MISLLPCKTSCRLYIHLAFTYSVGPSSVVCWELGPAQPFPTNESAWSAMVTGLQSRVWSGPENAVQCSQYYFLGHHCCKFGSKEPVDVMIRIYHKICMDFNILFCRIILQADIIFRKRKKKGISPSDDKRGCSDCNEIYTIFYGLPLQPTTPTLVQRKQLMWWKESFTQSCVIFHIFCTLALAGWNARAAAVIERKPGRVTWIIRKKFWAATAGWFEYTSWLRWEESSW